MPCRCVDRYQCFRLDICNVIPCRCVDRYQCFRLDICNVMPCRCVDRYQCFRLDICNVMPCRCVDRYQCFKGTFCLLLQGRRLSEPKDGGSTFFWNISACLPSCTMSYLETPQISQVFWHVYVLGGMWKKKSHNIVTSSHPVLVCVWCNMMLEQWNLLETLTLTLATYTHVWARNALGGKGSDRTKISVEAITN